MVEGGVRLHLELYKASGVELIMGEAYFVGRNWTMIARKMTTSTRLAE
jgi:hypothetical protein